MDDIRRPNGAAKAEKALKVLQGEYVVVARRHIRVWRLLLVLGLIIGAVIAIAIIARRSVVMGPEAHLSNFLFS